MSDRAALVAEVIANPDDDLPRLVFADFLDETGEPSDAARAEFIRAQVRAAQVAAGIGSLGHPPADWCDCDRCRCERIAVHLFDKWGTSWSPWAVMGSGSVRNWHRGFIWSVEARCGTIIAKLPGMLQTEPVGLVEPTNIRPVMSGGRWALAYVELEPLLGKRAILAAAKQYRNRSDAMQALSDAMIADAREKAGITA